MDAAKSFQQESGTHPGVDLDAITDRMHIRKAVQGGDIEEAIDLVNDFNPEVGPVKGTAVQAAPAWTAQSP